MNASTNQYKKKKYYISYAVRSDTDKLLKQCLKVFVEDNPEFEQVPISRNKIIYELAKFYLNPKLK